MENPGHQGKFLAISRLDQDLDHFPGFFSRLENYFSRFFEFQVGWNWQVQRLESSHSRSEKTGISSSRLRKPGKSLDFTLPGFQNLEKILEIHLDSTWKTWKDLELLKTWKASPALYSSLKGLRKREKICLME